MKYLILLCLLISGCAQTIVRTDHVYVKVNTLLKDVNIEQIIFGNFFLKRLQADSEKFKAITPYGVIETGE